MPFKIDAINLMQLLLKREGKEGCRKNRKAIPLHATSDPSSYTHM